MKIVVATPLYPPEVAESASYAKELAKRLSEGHRVAVVAYTRMPEKVPGVVVAEVNKGRPLPERLLSFFSALLRASKQSDVTYALNGPSVELPLLFASLVARRPFVFIIADTAAHAYAKKSVFRRTLEKLVERRARKVITQMPLARPEILPFNPPPSFDAYEESWRAHMALLQI